MPIPPVPRLVLLLERTTGTEPIAAWELRSDGAVDVTPGVAGVQDALDWATNWAPQEGPAIDMPSPDAWVFGADGVSSSTTTRYLAPGYYSDTAPSNPPSYRSPVAGTLSDLRLRHNRTGGNGKQIVYTLRINGAPTALSVSLASTAQDGSDLVNSVSVAVGDLVDIQVTKAASTFSSPDEVTASLRVDF